MSGVLVALAFPPYGRAFLAWVGLVPAFLALARCSPRGAILGGLVFGALAVTMGVWGLHAAGKSIPTTEPGDVRIVGIQGEGILLDDYLQTSVEALRLSPSARLVVWPEYALGRTLTERGREIETVRAFAGEWNVPVLFGAARGRTNTDFENTLFLVGATGVIGTQVKSEPIPFFVDGHAAKGREPLTAGGMTFGAAICYDLDFPYVSRELVAKGAQLLVFPTMDAEHWGEVEHIQHATIAPLRAVEHRRWIVRVASSGISQVIDPYGEVRLSTPIGKRAILPADVRLSSETTLYDRGGWLLPHVCLGVAALLVAIAAVRERALSKRPPA